MLLATLSEVAKRDIARSIRKDLDKTDSNPKTDITSVLSQLRGAEIPFPSLLDVATYYSSFVPWGTEEASSLAQQIIASVAIDWERYVAALKPHLLAIAHRPHGGLRPRLGYSAKHEISEEDARRAWKSDSVHSLAWVALLIDKGPEEYIPLASSFILNVGGDYEPWLKAQTCRLMRMFVARDVGRSFLLRSGLHSEFVDTAKRALVHIPNTTPVSDSVHVLTESYECIFELFALKSDLLQRCEVLDTNILGSITYLLGNRTAYPVVSLLFRQLERMDLPVLLLCLSRAMFLINQAATNPDALDDEGGIEVVKAALRSQRKIISDNAPLTEYRYDLVGMWVVLIRRIDRFERLYARYEGVRELIRENITLYGGHDDVGDIIEEVKKEYDVKDYWREDREEIID